MRTIYACILRDTQTLLFGGSTLFTLEIGRHVCMVREALGSNFGCACLVRLQVRSGRSATYSCPQFGFPRVSQVKVKYFSYVHDPRIHNS